MSHGRVGKARRRYPVVRQRMERFSNSPRGHRGSTLPPHLLPGITRSRKRGRVGMTVAASLAILLFLTTIFLSVVLVAGSSAAIGGTVRAYRELNEQLPSAALAATDTFDTTIITDRNGVVLQEVDDPNGGWRSFVTLDQVSPFLINATISSEDATYWSHRGIEPVAILRGVVINVGGSGSSGGSTITQQLARGLYPEEIGYDISVTRKFREALAAVALENDYSKADILTMYLNQIYYGQRSYGIEAAARTYFQKNAKDLTLGEASMLAGLPQAPSFYDPTLRFDIAKKRQQYVLDQMVKYKYITEEQAQTAYREPLAPQRRTSAVLHAPHFTDYAKQYVADRWGIDALYKGGLRITTTLDVNLQDQAQTIVQSNLAEISSYQRNNAAMVAIVPWSGEVLTMVGSANFNDASIGGQVNYATAEIQPGSSIKPVVYAAAFEAGWNPGTIVFDTTFSEETAIGPYEPKNYNGYFYGAVTVRTALANSLNIPAVKAAKYAGVDRVIQLAQDMGARTSYGRGDGFYGLAFALGSGEVKLVEHTNVFATLANNGRYVPATPILKITDNKGNVLFDLHKDLKKDSGEQVLRAEYAYQITHILTDNEARAMIFGRGNRFERVQEILGRPTAAKSGTTDDWKDIWTMGYTTDLAVGVWVGRTTETGELQTNLPEIDGIAGAGPIWEDMMVLLHDDSKYRAYLNGPDKNPVAEAFPRPSGIVEREVCVATGGRPTGSGDTKTEVLAKGNGPAIGCNQLSAYYARELAFALKDANTGRYGKGGVESINAFARAIGKGNVPNVATGNASEPAIVPVGGGNSGDGGDSTDSGDNTFGGADAQPTIEPSG